MNIRDFNWPVVLIWLGLSCVGLLAIYSSTQGPVAEFLPAIIRSNFQKQLLFALLAVAVVFIIQLFNPRLFQDASYVFYAGGLVLMVLTLAFGQEINGSRSWLRFGFFNFQTSELMKIATILASARYMTHEHSPSLSRWRSSLVIIGLFTLPTGLVLLQNDTGTALIFLVVLPVMLFWNGLSTSITVLIILPALVAYLSLINLYAAIIAVCIAAIAVWMLEKQWMHVAAAFVLGGLVVGGVNVAMEQVLKPHQKNRIEAFVHPEVDPLGAGWNVLQAKTAIGSGGWSGKGFMEGTQTQLRFIPEQWTDFIFCVIGEEFGFLGSSFVLLLYLGFFLTLLRMAAGHKHPFAQLLTIGVTCIYLFHFLINLGSAMGLLPVIGIPLPFISYGGSSLLSNSLMLAICLNVDFKKRQFSIYR
jgi:rod shape determining protein RodA